MKKKRIAVTTIGARIGASEEAVFNDLMVRALYQCEFDIVPEYTDNHDKAVWSAVNTRLARPDIDALLLCDVDVVPVKMDKFVNWLRAVVNEELYKDAPLIGIRQNANHLPGTPDYVAPGFALFRSAWWRAKDRIRRQPAVKGPDWDLLGRHTKFVEKEGAAVHYLQPGAALVPRWCLEDGTEYGIGTYYPEASIIHVYAVRDEVFSKQLLRWLGEVLK